MGCDDESDRLQMSENMMNSGFAEFEIYFPAAADYLAEFAEMKVAVSGGTVRELTIAVQCETAIVVPRGRTGAIRYNVCLPDEITAPISAGHPVGTITATLDNIVLYEGYIIAASEVPRLTFGRVLGALIRGFFGV
jgi:D-alanyl-D-alanine carboxypeptidase (penicillin-binding protein 5/6)